MQLNRKYLRTNLEKLKHVTVGSLEEMPERIIQFGEGNFLRAFVDWQFNELAKKGLFKGKVVIVQPLEDGMLEQLADQEYLYTLIQRGFLNGEMVDKRDIITVISRGINPYSQWNEFLLCAHNPDLRYMFSNTTESGIVYTRSPFPEHGCPASFPAKLTAFLFERFSHFAGSPSHGMLLFPCELIENNGSELKACILRHAEDWRLGSDFTGWLEQSNFFYDTLVDRIVPGFPKDEIATIEEELGYEDDMLVAAEVFHLWAILGDGVAQRELPFAKAGLNVHWTDDLESFRTLKVRILNGLHTMVAVPAFLIGKETVRESIEDDLVGEFVLRGLNEEILPTLASQQGMNREFADAILERFKNPFVAHYLMSITLNSVSKFKVRVLPSLLTYQEQKKTLPPVLTFSLASLIEFFRGIYNGDHSLVAWRGGKHYTAKDDSAVLKFFSDAHSHFKNDPLALCAFVLKNELLWGMNLTTIPELVEAVSSSYVDIREVGMKLAMENLLANANAKVVVEKEKFQNSDVTLNIQIK